MSLHCLCCDTSLVYSQRFVQYFWRVKKNVPFSFSRIFLCFELPGNGSDLRTPKVIMYMNFKFYELRLMPKVLSSSLCV